MTARVSRQHAAEQVGHFLYDHRDYLFTVDEIADATGLTVTQIRGAEAELKAFVARYKREFADYALYIPLGPEGLHGFITDSTRVLGTVVSRAKYMQTRAGTELDYAVQAGARVEDARVKRLLRRARTQQRAVVETMDAVYEILTSEPELLAAASNGDVAT
jgi:hypothetical protein